MSKNHRNGMQIITLKSKDNKKNLKVAFTKFKIMYKPCKIFFFHITRIDTIKEKNTNSIN